MGLFDKKKKDDFGSPVEEVNLNAPRPTTGAAPSQPVQTKATPAPAAVAADEPPPEFGINQAIELMRELPKNNTEVVVTVVKTTLGALKIKVGTIIKDADRKLKSIEGKVDGLKKEIVDFEAEIATRRGQIAALEADHQETTGVKEQLILSETLAERGKSGAPEPKAKSPAAAK